MKKVESPFTCKLQKWMKYNMLDIKAYGWEVKYPKTKNYSFSSDKSFKKELTNLLIWYHGIIIHKFSDIARMGTIHDGFTARGEAFFFFTWDGKKFYVISVEDIKDEVDSGAKSINEERAKELSIIVDSVK